MRSGKISQSLLSLVLLVLAGGCQTFLMPEAIAPVQLPFIKNSANECYYLDEFMPVPDALVSGESGAMRLRYYTYKLASYKDWDRREIVLSFYSRDDKCWSLFEEYYVVR